MKMTMQTPVLAMIVIAMLLQVTVGATTLKHAHHKADHKKAGQPIDIPDDGADVDPAVADDSAVDDAETEDAAAIPGDTAEEEAKVAESVVDEEMKQEKQHRLVAHPHPAKKRAAPRPRAVAKVVDQEDSVTPEALLAHERSKLQREIQSRKKAQAAHAHAKAQPTHLRAAPKAAPKRRLRAAPKPVHHAKHPVVEEAAEAPVSGESLSSLLHDLKEERGLRLSAEKMVNKLTGVLNHTTAALKLKDQEALSVQKVGDAQKAKLHNTQAALTAEQQVEKALRTHQAVAVSHSQKLLADAHKAMSDERKMRVAAERQAKSLAARLRQSAGRGLNPAQLKKENADLKGANKQLMIANAAAKKELDKLADNVDEAEAARKTKTDLLKGKVKEIDDLKTKEKVDLASLLQKEEKLMATQKQQFKDEEAKKEAIFKSQNTLAHEAIAKLTTKVQELNATDTKLVAEVSKDEKLLKEEQDRAEGAEKNVLAEHKAFLNSEKEVADQQTKLSKDTADMKKLQVEADKLQQTDKVEKDEISKLSSENKELNENNEEEKDELKMVQKKLQDEDQNLQVLQKKLKANTGKLKSAKGAKTKADTRVHQLWQALKEKKAQMQINDEELKAVQKELAATSEQKDVLVKELDVTEKKLAEKAKDEKELAAAKAKVVESDKTVAAKDQEMVKLQAQLKEAGHKVDDFDTVKAKLAASAAVQKELTDQLSLAKQLEKDKLAAAAATEQELNTRLQAAYKKEKDLTAKQSEEMKKKDKVVHDVQAEEARIKANRLADELNAEQASAGGVQDMSDDEFLLSGGAEKEVLGTTNKTKKAALLTGNAVLRTRNLQNELAASKKQLQDAQARVLKMTVDATNKDLELEQSRQALLHAASVQLPPATAIEASAARKALENINGKLDAQERELNASKLELKASASASTIEQKELVVLKDDHVQMGKKVKKLSAALIKEYTEKKRINEELIALKASLEKTEKAKKEALKKAAELEKLAKAAKAKEDAAAAAKAAAAKKAADEAAAEKATQAKAAAEQEAAEQKAKAEEEQKQKAQAKKNTASKDDDDDDDGDADDDDSPAGQFAQNVPWDSVQDKLKKNMNLAGKATQGW